MRLFGRVSLRIIDLGRVIAVALLVATLSGQTFAAGLEPKLDLPVGTAPLGIAIGDIDGDGRQDIVATAHEDDTVVVIRNIGGPHGLSFGPGVEFQAGSHPQGIALADLDEDDRLDIAIANSGRSWPPGSLAILRNISEPGRVAFAAPETYPVEAGHRVAVGDLDGDGRLDLVVSGNANNKLVIFKNVGGSTGTLLEQVSTISAITPNSVGIADIDGDGRLDIVNTVNTVVVQDSLSVHLNQGTPGTFMFAPPQSFPASVDPDELTILDITDDGKPDIVVANRSNSISIFSNLGTPGSVSLSRTDHPAGAEPIGIAVADLDGDGNPDVVVTNDDDHLQVLRTQIEPNGISLNPVEAPRTGNRPYLIASGDLDGDGDEDLALTNNDATTVSVFRNTNAGGMTTSLRIGAIGPQEKGVPFGVVIEATGEEGVILLNGKVHLQVSIGNVSPFSLQMTDGRAVGAITVDSAGQDVQLSAVVADLSAVSNSFDLVGEASPGWLTGKVDTWSVLDGGTVPVYLEARVNVNNQTGAVLSAGVVEGKYKTDLLPCGSYLISAEAGERVTDWKAVEVPCGFGVKSDFILEAEECDTSNLTPVLLVPGIMGSTTGSGLIPELPKGPITWNDQRWPGWSWSWWGGRQGGLYPDSSWPRLVDHLRQENPNFVPYCGVFPVPYDWRESPEDVLAEFLLKQITHVLEVTGSDKVHIVAHSMGGLVARACLQDENCAEKVERVALVGTPNQGSPLAYYIWSGRSRFSHGLVLDEMAMKELHQVTLTTRDRMEFVREKVKSVRSLLPTYPFLERAGSLNTLSCGADRNTWLEELNDGSLPAAETARFFSGTGTLTVERIFVGTSDCNQSDGFESGRPLFVCRPSSTSASTGELCYRETSGNGDGTVPIFSSRPAGVDYPEQEGTHQSLVGTFAESIANFLIGQAEVVEDEQLIGEGVTVPEESMALGLSVDGNLQALLMDPLGRRLGVDMVTGHVLDEVPDSDFSSNPKGASLAIAGPEQGEYRIDLFGPAEEDFRIQIGCSNLETLLLHGFHSGETSTIKFNFDSLASPCIAIGESPPGPLGVTADVVVSVIPETVLSWAPVPEASVAFYRVYGKRQDEPVLRRMVETVEVSWESGDPWSETVESPVRVYAVSVVDHSGRESLLSEIARNDDRDHDGISDVEEDLRGLPRDDPDADGDGVVDGDELIFGTEPTISDSDGDGFTDGAELSAASNALDPNSTPECPVGVQLFIPPQSIEGERFFEACQLIETEPGVSVGSTGRAVFRSSYRVIFGDGFSVESGGRLVVEIGVKSGLLSRH